MSLLEDAFKVFDKMHQRFVGGEPFILDPKGTDFDTLLQDTIPTKEEILEIFDEILDDSVKFLG
jgi:hypothetical protein|tara:strand:- start:127 stop:318 length:192 start_codon:yes stop_codon:yes gene_type:complete